MQERFRDKYRILGLRIAFYRKAKGLTQEQFAEAVGKSWSFISQVEANNGLKIKGVSLDTLFTISEILDIPVAKFFEDI